MLERTKNPVALTLFPFQDEGARWLASKKYALLADEMGLGKSCQAITAAASLALTNILILCPAVARLNWLNEFAMWWAKSGLKIHPVLTQKDWNAALGANVVIVSYDLAASPTGQRFLTKRTWDLCLADESHYLKNRNAKRTLLVYKQLLPHAKRIWLLSGTPAPNHSAELWPAVHALGISALPYWDFVNRFCTGYNGIRGFIITGNQRVGELRRLLAPFVLRRKKEEVKKDMPPILITEYILEDKQIPLEVWEKHFSSYLIRRDDFAKDMASVEEQIRILLHDMEFVHTDSMVAILQGLLDVPKVKSYRRWIGIQKVAALIELISSELLTNQYQKIVLFGVHKTVLEELVTGLKEFGVVAISGSTAGKQRQEAVEKFQNNPKIRVFVGQMQAAGIAITLTAADQVGIVEEDWVPANNAQAIMRVHRIGQTRPVNVRFFRMKNSIDQKIQDTVIRKTKMLMEIFDEPPPVDPFV